jgi:hypothetical protein
VICATPPRDQPRTKVAGRQATPTSCLGIVPPYVERISATFDVVKHEPKFDLDISAVSRFTMAVVL